MATLHDKQASVLQEVRDERPLCWCGLQLRRLAPGVLADFYFLDAGSEEYGLNVGRITEKTDLGLVDRGSVL